VILTRALAAVGHYPDIDILLSASRVMNAVVEKEHKAAAARLRELLATYNENKDAILYNIYKKGTDSKIDEAIEKIDQINAFLKQGLYEQPTFEETLEGLKKI